MRFHIEDIVKQARDLRLKGYSAQAIGKKLGVSEMSVLRWCFDIPSTNRTHLKSLAKLNESKNKSSGLVGKIKLNQDFSKIFASLMYWCEGSKYPASNIVAFANSDPNLIKTFLKFFRKGFSPTEEKFRIQLQLHDTQDYIKIRNYWVKFLKISPELFYKPTVTSPGKRRKRKNYLGTCTIRYNDVKLLMEIMGIYESFIRRRGRAA